MRKDWVLTQESFDALLAWLSPDREQAGAKYEEIRTRLITIFTCRACGEPEDLADETINRVINKLPEIKDGFIGDPARYFYGVANNVHKESLRPKPTPAPPPPSTDADEIERELKCLERCMQQLPKAKRELLVEYYQDEKSAKIDHRKHLAVRLGIAINALRIRAHRGRVSLADCVRDCLSATAA